MYIYSPLPYFASIVTILNLHPYSSRPLVTYINVSLRPSRELAPFIANGTRDQLALPHWPHWSPFTTW